MLACGSLLLAVLATLAACGSATLGSSPGTVSSRAQPGCDTTTQWRPPSDNVQLNDLALTGPGEGWAIGSLTGDPRQPGYSGPTGVIYQLTNGHWQRLPQTYPGEDLTSIAMASPTDGWIVASGSAMFLLRYDGNQWRKVDVPAIDAAFGPPGGVSVPGYGLGKVQMFGSTAWYFAATDNPLYPNDPNSRATSVVILRYSNGAWTTIPAPHIAGSVTLFDFAASSADEAWLLGEDYQPSSLPTILYHYANGQWTTWPTTYPGGSGQHLQMLSPTNGWTYVGDAGTPQTLLHYDGSTWAPIDLSQVDHFVGTVQYMAAIGEPAPSVTWFTAFTSARANTILASQSLLAYNGGAWQHVTWPYTGHGLDRIVGAGDGNLWAIGNINHQEGCPPLLTTAVEQGVFYSYIGGQWHETLLP